MTQLAVYEHAREALAAAVQFDEVTRIHSQAEKAAAYARIAKDRKMQADAAEIVARAERKLGIMLRGAKDDGLMSKGGRPSHSNVSEPETGATEEPVFDNTPFTLAEIGVDKKLSSRAQRVAALDEDTFESAVTETREKILDADAPVVRAPKLKVVKVEKPEPVKPLEPRRFHQFAFSVLAMSVASNRVGSETIHFLARECGIVEGDDEDFDWTLPAEAAMGSIVVAGLSALAESEKNIPEGSGTAREASGGQPLPGDGDIGKLQQGTQSAPHPHLAKLELREAYEGEIALLAPQRGKLSMKQAEAAMRAGYAAEVPLVLMVEDLGHPHGTIAGWANRLGLTNAARMVANQKRFGGEA